MEVIGQHQALLRVMLIPKTHHRARQSGRGQRNGHTNKSMKSAMTMLMIVMMITMKIARLLREMADLKEIFDETLVAGSSNGLHTGTNSALNFTARKFMLSAGLVTPMTFVLAPLRDWLGYEMSDRMQAPS
jgi:hypothetical protein